MEVWSIKLEQNNIRRKSTANSMINNNEPIEKIIKYSGLSKNKILNLK